MLARVRTSALSGLEAVPVDVEVQIQEGKRLFTIVGLGDNAVRESRERVTSAIQHAGFQLPDRILVNLAPAELKKEGSGFDLPIALAVLAASGQIDPGAGEHRFLHGELSLDGRVKPVRGVVALTAGAVGAAGREIVVPAENRAEAALIEGLEVIAVQSLGELVQWLTDGVIPEGGTGTAALFPPERPLPAGISDVWGQDAAKRAMLIAAAGGHNLLMIGPPGCGKSMLAQRFTSLLPPLTGGEVLEVVRIHSVAGLPVPALLRGERPFRSPHYTVSDAGLIGGGAGPRAGEISLAHRGVLFLDEFPEYRRSAIEALRTPLEAGAITVSRARGAVSFPARFQLIAAMNPCPCGRLGSGSSCTCTRTSIAGYLKKLSQPILDRIDLHVELNPVPVAAMTSRVSVAGAEEENELRERVRAAQLRQRERGGVLNSELAPEEVKRIVEISEGGLRLLEHAAQRMHLSARGYMRILRVARTIADLAGESAVRDEHIAEAIQFRCLERIQRYCAGG